MTLEEIWVNPDRDEYLDSKYYPFMGANAVAKIRNLILKKIINENDIYYGLFDEKDQLVGYFKITRYNNQWYKVLLSQIAPAYKGQGYGTFLYTYCVLNDKTNLLSDDNLTPQSLKLWNSIRRSGQFIVKVFDKQTGELSDDFSVLEDNNRYLLAGLPTGKTINETLHERNAVYNGERYIVWFGPTTVCEEFFNY